MKIKNQVVDETEIAQRVLGVIEASGSKVGLSAESICDTLLDEGLFVPKKRIAKVIKLRLSERVDIVPQNVRNLYRVKEYGQLPCT